MVLSEFAPVSLKRRLASKVRGQVRFVWLTLAVLCIAAGGLGMLSRSPQVLASSSLAAKAAASPVVPPSAAAGAAIHPASATPAAAPPSCTPDTTYGLPAPLSLATAQTGLTQVTDAASRYVIYGNTTAQIHGQMQQCAPGDSSSSAGGGDEFAAETGYRLTWQYSTTADDNGICSVNNVKVGLHLNMVLPEWQQTAGASNGLAGTWQKFITSLATHESGHVAIDQQYAGQLLGDLQAYPSTDCGSIAAGVQAKVNADIAALTAANDAYDARTNHGATQGAILP